LVVVAGGWWLVAGGWWLVAGGWWLVAGGWWLVAGGWWLVMLGWMDGSRVDGSAARLVRTAKVAATASSRSILSCALHDV
jgi:hypothetical protein